MDAWSACAECEGAELWEDLSHCSNPLPPLPLPPRLESQLDAPSPSASSARQVAPPRPPSTRALQQARLSFGPLGQGPRPLASAAVQLPSDVRTSVHASQSLRLEPGPGPPKLSQASIKAGPLPANSNPNLGAVSGAGLASLAVEGSGGVSVGKGCVGTTSGNCQSSADPEQSVAAGLAGGLVSQEMEGQAAKCQSVAELATVGDTQVAAWKRMDGAGSGSPTACGGYGDGERRHVAELEGRESVGVARESEQDSLVVGGALCYSDSYGREGEVSLRSDGTGLGGIDTEMSQMLSGSGNDDGPGLRGEADDVGHVPFCREWEVGLSSKVESRGGLEREVIGKNGGKGLVGPSYASRVAGANRGLEATVLGKWKCNDCGCELEDEALALQEHEDYHLALRLQHEQEVAVQPIARDHKRVLEGGSASQAKRHSASRKGLGEKKKGVQVGALDKFLRKS